MIDTSSAAWADLKNRLLFVLFAILVFRMGSHVPVPGVDLVKLTDFFDQQSTGILGLFNMFSGGAFSRLTLFALGIMPYISASIVMQLLSLTMPSLERLRKEDGDAGRQKISQYTRYGALGLALAEGIALCTWLISGGYTFYVGMEFYLIGTLTLATGTMFLMWLGEQITERGVGNGISLIIFLGIIARLPEAADQMLLQVKQGEMLGIVFISIIAFALIVVAAIVAIERAQRQITIQQPKRQQGNRMTAAQSSKLPLKINMAGVLPPIFAIGAILFPATIARWLGQTETFSFFSNVSYVLSPGQPMYFLLYCSAILFFAFFWTSLMFNPTEMADNLKRSGALVPGIRPGAQTASYIDSVMTRLTLVGASYLCIIALMPEIMILTWNVPFQFGGTSLLIVVVVVMDFIGQVQNHLLVDQYQFSSKSNKRGSSKLALLR